MENNVTLVYFDYTEQITKTYVKNKMTASIKGEPICQPTNTL